MDANGTLAMATNGYTVMGYGTTTDTEGATVINTASLTSLDIMSDENMISEPVATTNGYITGILDKNSDALSTTAGQAMSIPFYDNLGYSYTARFKIEKSGGATAADNGQYTLTMTDIMDSEGKSILTEEVTGTDGKKKIEEMKPDKKETTLAAAKVFSLNRTAGTNVATLTFDTYNTAAGTKAEGKLKTITVGGATSTDDTKENGEKMLGLTLNLDGIVDQLITSKGTIPNGFRGIQDAEKTKGIAIDFSEMLNIDNKGSSTVNGKRGRLESDAGAGCAAGEMSSISIGMDGKITASYTNGQTKLLGQIATATFANAAGLEKAGDNLYATTLNSGEPVINDITANGGSMSSGELEMSNVDLSAEFTDMITTQRGFQANSRIITVSDSMLEELVNLKR